VSLHRAAFKNAFDPPIRCLYKILSPIFLNNPLQVTRPIPHPASCFLILFPVSSPRLSRSCQRLMAPVCSCSNVQSIPNRSTSSAKLLCEMSSNWGSLGPVTTGSNKGHLDQIVLHVGNVALQMEAQVEDIEIELHRVVKEITPQKTTW